MLKLTDLSKYKRIAVMGGTFDPIHFGHLVAAEAVRHEFNIDKVLFMPAGRPAHKQNAKVTENEHRFLMTALAVSSNPYFEVSRVELDRNGITYTVDTINELRKYLGKNTKIYFITGADAISQILTWKDAEQLLSICSFVAVTRPGYKKKALISEFQKNFNKKLHFIEIPALAISSTDIRHRVASGKPIKYLLPDEVETYIIKNQLYGDKPVKDEYGSIDQALRRNLSERRYIHTTGVASAAVSLAKLYGVDIEKAYTAALLHDYAKEYSDELKSKMCKEFGIVQDEVLIKQPDLTHSFLGAELAKREFGICDEDILNAIRYHTTGRAEMSLLEKIIYIADCIEPNREAFEGLSDISDYAYTDLNKAVCASLKYTIEYNKRKNRMIHPLSITALAYYS